MQKSSRTRKYYLRKIVYEAFKKSLILPAKIFAGRAFDSSRHSVVMPESMYSPWMADVTFQDIYAQIKNNTQVDEYKCYELWSLIEQVRDIEGDILEVGVWRGGSGCLIAKKCALEQIDLKLYLCDTFRGVVKVTDQDQYYYEGEINDTSQQIVETLASNLSLKNIKILKGIFPDETAEKIHPNTKFRLCHIDVDIYNSAKDVLNWVWDKMPIGGVVVFDDYGCITCPGIVNLIEEEALKPDRLYIHNLNGHALLIKIK